MHTPVVRRALEIIRREFATVTVKVLCARLRVGRSTLYDEFERCWDRSPGAVIRETKLQHLCNRLDDNPERSLGAVAAECGYSSASSAAHAFQKARGVSPRVFLAMARMRGRHMASLFESLEP